jgi:hypothetical protein
MDKDTARTYKQLLLGIPGWNNSGTRQAFLQDVFWGHELLNQIDSSAPGDRAATELVALLGGLDDADVDGLTPACALLKAIRKKFGAGRQRGELLADLEGTLCQTTSSIRSVLILAANPEDQELIRTDREYAAIKQALSRPAKGEQIQLRLPEFSLSAERLIESLLGAEEPNVVHFSGHGGGAEGLYFEDAQGNSEPASADALANVFQQFAHCVRLVVLNACYSEPQATAIARHIDYVIGTREDVGDDTAIAFSTGFYQALAAGRPIEDAFQLGCAQIRMAGIPEHLIPVLMTREGKVIPCA